MPNVVGERFQITIDKKVREQLGILPGDQAIEQIVDGRLVIDFVRPHSQSMRGIFRKLSDEPIVPIEDWGALKDRAWAARTTEIMDVLRRDSQRHGEGEGEGEASG